MPGRIIGTRLPCCPGKDSRYAIRHHQDRPGNPWWVHYEPPGADPIPADDPHDVLVKLVNDLKREMAQTEGGGFSINEHGQVIARTKAPAGPGNTAHIIDVTSAGAVSTYHQAIIFQGGQLDPRATPKEGDVWPGPLSGMTYSFVEVNNPKPPSRNLDEVFVLEEGTILQLSTEGGIDPYPPTTGPLATFLKALRRQLPKGGRFRVNEHGRAFTSSGTVFIGTVPLAAWFRPLTARS